jgi:protein-tyrosine-phosphatase
MQRHVAFVCLHGSAKSVIAAEYAQRAAAERGIALRTSAAGREPDDSLPPHVLQGMAQRGFDLGGRVPRAVTAESLSGADPIVSFGCDLSALAPGRSIERWDDCPNVSDGFDAAWDAITRRVDRLLDGIAESKNSPTRISP